MIFDSMHNLLGYIENNIGGIRGHGVVHQSPLTFYIGGEIARRRSLQGAKCPAFNSTYPKFTPNIIQNSDWLSSLCGWSQPQ